MAADEAFDDEIELAKQGRWEELGLDPPPDNADGGFRPASLNEFLDADQ